MGCSASVTNVTYQSAIVSKYPIRRNLEIERNLRQWDFMRRQQVKLILLGAAESGKSTILKQIRIINAEGYSKEELRSKKSSILWNVLDCLITIVEAMDQLKLGFADPALNSKAAMLKEKFALTVAIDNFDLKTKEIIKELWSDPGLQNCFERRNEYQLADCAKYFLDAIDRLAAQNYVPTIDDLLHCRIQTTGVVNLEFTMKEMNVRVVDVGGQRSERRKWIHHFDDSHAVIFVTSLSEYDLLCAEDNQTNRMKESQTLFDQICNSSVFKKSSMILFFNKKDLFAEKIKKTPITIVFNDYKGKQTYEDSVPFIIQKFKSLNRDGDKQLYCHETCATDTDQVHLILDSAWNIILKNGLKSNGII